MKKPLKVKKKFENNLWVVGRYEGRFFIGRTCKIDQIEMASIITGDGNFKMILFNDIEEIKKISFHEKLSKPNITSSLSSRKKLSTTEKSIVEILNDINRS